MILHLKPNITSDQAAEAARIAQAIHVQSPSGHVLVTSSKVHAVPAEVQAQVAESWDFQDDMQLSSRKYLTETREIHIGEAVLGGSRGNTVMMTGPCSVESEAQLETSAQLCVELGIKVLRGGAYKPRTSPYTFQGLGLEGLQLLAKMRDKYGLAIISEVRDATHIEEVIEYADVIQVGAKAMYDQGILRRCGKARKPILIKRGFGSSLQELVQAAEFVLAGGNEQVILCERGIRTFETKTRFTLDLCGAVYLKAHTNLPVVLDPSHAMGFAYGVPDLARACTALGVDGLLIESHPNPAQAKSDAAQQLDPDTFRNLYQSLQPIAQAVGRQLV
ncbi:MAG TPA: 3-deoxy-7-phosphoheptulonate synthase [Bacteroidetes bacterium]|nr:3-deoxy-7-phosphoheptulonate synthase [Bacteroidota bacterium]